MNADALQQIAQSVENYIGQLRQHADELKRQLNDVENNKGTLKQRIMAEVAATITHDVGRESAARIAQEQYRVQAKAGDDQAKGIKDAVQAVQKHIGETESVHTELRRYEASLRDLESKASSYAQQAQSLMSRGIG